LPYCLMMLDVLTHSRQSLVILAAAGSWTTRRSGSPASTCGGLEGQTDRTWGKVAEAIGV